MYLRGILTKEELLQHGDASDVYHIFEDMKNLSLDDVRQLQSQWSKAGEALISNFIKGIKLVQIE